MKKYNGKLAILCFIGMIGKQFTPVLISMITAFLGVSALAAYSVGNTAINLVSACISIVTLIAVFKPNNILTYIACGIELLLILLCFITPQGIMILFNSSPEIFPYGTDYLTVSSLVMLEVSIACVLFRIIVNESSLKIYIIITIAGIVLSVLIPLVLTIILQMGTAGLGFSNIIQPIITIMPLLMLNTKGNLTAEMKGDPAPAKKSEHSYLDEYKRKMKEGQ